MADTRIDGSSVLEDMSCDQHENEYIKRSAMFVHLVLIFNGQHCMKSIRSGRLLKPNTSN